MFYICEWNRSHNVKENRVITRLIQTILQKVSPTNTQQLKISRPISVSLRASLWGVVSPLLLQYTRQAMKCLCMRKHIISWLYSSLPLLVFIVSLWPTLTTLCEGIAGDLLHHQCLCWTEDCVATTALFFLLFFLALPSSSFATELANYGNN